MLKEGWEYRKIKDVGTVVSGGTPKTNEPAFWNGDINWITPAELNGTKFYGETERKITEEGKNQSGLNLMPVGTVLLSSRAPIGKVSITTEPMCCNQGFKNIICSESINNEFLYYFLKDKKDYLNSLGRGATFKEISKKIVEDIQVPVPPLSEQESIVEELDLLTGIIDKKKSQLKELDNLAQATFYEMFGDPITNEKGWPRSTFGENFTIGSGGTPSKAIPEYWENGDIPWIGSNLCQNTFIYETDGKFITEEGLLHSSAKLLSEGYLLIALVGATIGKVGLLKCKTATNQNIAYVNVVENHRFNPTYMFYFTQGVYPLFAGIGDGKFKMANQQFVRNLPLSMPDIRLQNDFSEIIENLEHQKSLISQSIKDTQTLLDSTMDKYFG